MKPAVRFYGLVAILIVIAALFLIPRQPGQAQTPQSGMLITGFIHDHQGSAIQGASISLMAPGVADPLAETLTQPDGRFTLVFTQNPVEGLSLRIKREHFSEVDIPVDGTVLEELRSSGSAVIPEVILQRRINLSFWIATLVFIGMLISIAWGRLHSTLSALLGAAIVFAVSYLGHPISEEFYIFDFAGALHYVDWNVIFLIMGMMIIIAAVERTGIFQWLAFSAYKLSGGRIWLLMPILMIIAGIASAFLDNVTTMLLMTPITVQIALAMGINPLVLLLPEVMSSNVVGISTLVGTPTNILIGSYGKISFNAFLSNLTPGVLLAMVGLIIYSEFINRKDLHPKEEEEEGVSKMLLDKLAERARITEPTHLKKAGVVGAFMLVLFVTGERIHLLPAVTALMGATALLVWIRPDIEEMIEAVDWTTLVFFITLFIVVGAIQEVGLISIIADGIGQLVSGNLLVGVLAVTWLSALLSTVIANIPFTAAMLPVVGYLTATIPGAQSKVLFYCLSVGSAMGGNGSLIGASANMVTAGIAERAGYPITYAHFMKKGLPALFITVGLASLWLIVRFIVLHNTGT
jgi:Na+/H+ antiporter NhaD/arsenite permease-like protein